MRVVCDISLRNFEFWNGGKDTSDSLTLEQIDLIEKYMTDMSGEWIDTEVNDFFWFERDTIAEWLGYADWEHFDDGISNGAIEDANNWKEAIVLYPTEENLTMMAEESGIDDVDLEECDSEEEKEELITSEFEEYWDGLSDKEKVRLNTENNWLFRNLE